MVDNVTGGRGYALPYPTNLLSEDVQRIIDGLMGVDRDVVALYALLDGKASGSHQHEISQVEGLQTALNGKASETHNHALSALSDVSTTGVVTGNTLRYAGGSWTAAPIGINDIPNLSETLTSMQGALANTDDGSF